MNFTRYDLKRLETYSRNLIDYHLVMDLLPRVAAMFFNKRLQVNLPVVQASLLLAMGLQHKSVSDLEVRFAKA